MATEYDAIRVSEDAKDAAAEAKRDDETWNDYVRRCAEHPPEPIEVVDPAGLEERLSTVEERTGRIERLLEDLTGQ